MTLSEWKSVVNPSTTEISFWLVATQMGLMALIARSPVCAWLVL